MAQVRLEIMEQIKAGTCKYREPFLTIGVDEEIPPILKIDLRVKLDGHLFRVRLPGELHYVVYAALTCHKNGGVSPPTDPATNKLVKQYLSGQTVLVAGRLYTLGAYVSDSGDESAISGYYHFQELHPNRTFKDASEL